MAKMTLFDYNVKMTQYEQDIAIMAESIAEKAADPTSKLEDILNITKQRDELKSKYDLLKAQHDEMEAQQRSAVALKAGSGGGLSADDVKLKAKAAFYKAALMGGDMAAVRKAYEGLGALPENTGDLGYGENLLPTTMSNELITEPFETNSLRTIEQVSQITGLEEPKLLFDIDDADLADITDQQTAKEIELTGGTVTYGRYKTKIVATIKDTVLHGTAFNLVTTIESALRSGLAQKEKMRAFATASDGTHDHMSFYLNSIKAVPGDNLIDAIIKAISDLPDSFSENAKIVMKKSDYFAAINHLANSAATLWGKKPEDVIGYPVIFNDRAAVPIVGDFRYARQNYDIGTIYETDKDAKAGEYYFVLTAWGDHRIKLASAFRTAYIRAMLIGATATAATNPPTAGDALTVSSKVFNNGGNGSGGTITYKWQYLNGATWSDDNTRTGNATSALTTVNAQDEGMSFRCKVTYLDSDGPATTVYTNVIENLA